MYTHEMSIDVMSPKWREHQVCWRVGLEKFISRCRKTADDRLTPPMERVGLTPSNARTIPVRQLLMVTTMRPPTFCCFEIHVNDIVEAVMKGSVHPFALGQSLIAAAAAIHIKVQGWKRWRRRTASRQTIFNWLLNVSKTKTVGTNSYPVLDCRLSKADARARCALALRLHEKARISASRLRASRAGLEARTPGPLRLALEAGRERLLARGGPSRLAEDVCGDVDLWCSLRSHGLRNYWQHYVSLFEMFGGWSETP
mmetsp:Transcript_3497/g.10077  ORF Transcript_3497/g.10077 Transcript_3497/m.10077 type:complete len:256 (-) Transcript_3497:14-781(-)